MPIGSVEGFLITLLFVVPGGLGVEFRRWFFPASTPSAFSELLHALGASSSALVIVEAGTGLIGLVTRTELSFGDALIRPVTEQQNVPTGWATWVYLLFLLLALVLPVMLGWLRRTDRVTSLFGDIAVSSKSIDHLFAEIWRPQSDGQAAWVIVETEDGRSLQGQVIFRTSVPEPPEVILEDVYDITDPKDVRPGGGLLWIPTQNLKRLWLLPKDAVPAEDNEGRG
jgi:hypothetical protein